jgi:Fe-S cluster assembly iron-binding protein IscA
MLSLTLEATHLIAEMLADPEVPEDAGVRIGVEGPGMRNGGTQLQVAIAAGPSDDDEVVETAGARVFIPAPLSRTLADKTLDARVDANEGVRFELGTQAQAF